MKKHLLTLGFSLFILPVVGKAGNMFGPAAFRNGSPLVSGVDGTYQATARAENVTGIFRFAYSGGTQTASATQNNWIFFVNGEVQKGSVSAAINGGSLTGILDNAPSSGFQTNTNGSIGLPAVLVSQSFGSGGDFSGKINLKSPSGEFSGNGFLESAPLQVTYYNIIQTNGNVIPFSVTNFPSNIPQVYFKFKGVRTSTSTSGASSTNAVTN